MRRFLSAVCGVLLLSLIAAGCQQSSLSQVATEKVVDASAAEPPAQVLVAGVTSQQFSSSRTNPADAQVLFIHGGSYVHEASALHAPFFREILRQVEATITMPIYALAPEHGYRVAYDQILDVYLELRREHPDAPIVLMGGSAGGGFALGFAQYLVVQGLPQPDRIVLLSPWLDLTLTNPAIPAVDRTDVLLNRNALLPNGLAWAHGDDPSGYQLSPVNGSLAGLAPTTVLAGTNDILYPDTLVLEARAETAGLEFELRSFDGADHVFAMSTGAAGDKAREIIEGIISSLDG